jgi:hypothetical protein
MEAATMFNNDDPFGSFQSGTPGKPAAVPQSAPATTATPVGATGVGAGNQQGNTPSFPSNQASGGGEQQNKYKILNMFWLVNPKAYNNAAMLDGEVHFTTISYNVNFGNLRIELASMSQDSIVGQMICLNKVNRLINATVYPTAMFQLVNNIPEIFCMEQIINYNNADWKNKLKPSKFVTNESGSITLTIENNCYEFVDWQKEALLYACKFALNNGLSLSGQNLGR